MKFLTALSLLALAATPALAAAPDLKVVDQIKVGGDGGWDYATYDPSLRKIYIAHGTTIASVDLATKTANPALLATQGAHIALPYDNGKSLLVTNGKSNTVTLNDAANGTQMASLATDAKPDGAILDTFTGHAFVMANGGNAVDVIDLAAQTVIAKIPVGGAAEGATMDGQGLVFTHLEDKNAIVVIDAKSMTVKATYSLKDCDEPSGIAFVAKGRLLLSACGNGLARITQADTGAEVATVAIGQHPDFALYDANRGMGYVPSGDGKLTAIDFNGAKPVLAGVIATQPGARTGALDPVSGDIFLPTADFGTPNKPGARAPAVPGTFRLLVVGK